MDPTVLRDWIASEVREEPEEETRSAVGAAGGWAEQVRARGDGDAVLIRIGGERCRHWRTGWGTHCGVNCRESDPQAGIRTQSWREGKPWEEENLVQVTV